LVAQRHVSKFHSTNSLLPLLRKTTITCLLSASKFLTRAEIEIVLHDFDCNTPCVIITGALWHERHRSHEPGAKEEDQGVKLYSELQIDSYATTNSGSCRAGNRQFRVGWKMAPLSTFANVRTVKVADQAVEECGKWWPETNTGRKQKLALDSVIYHLPSARVIHNTLLNIGSKIRSLEFAVNGAFRKIFSVKSYDVVSDWVKYFNCSVSKSTLRERRTF